jgi:uncharacterized protein YecE (DUF72 family)
VAAAGEKTRLMFAFFNNHWQGYAPRNAVDLKKSLQLPFQEIPVPITAINNDKINADE